MMGRITATMYSGLYQPQQWDEYGNSLLPQAIATVQNASNGSSTTITKYVSAQLRSILDLTKSHLTQERANVYSEQLYRTRRRLR